MPACLPYVRCVCRAAVSDETRDNDVVASLKDIIASPRVQDRNRSPGQRYTQLPARLSGATEVGGGGSPSSLYIGSPETGLNIYIFLKPFRILCVDFCVWCTPLLLELCLARRFVCVCVRVCLVWCVNFRFEICCLFSVAFLFKLSFW